MNKYIVHINPIPGTDSPRTIEVEGTDCLIEMNGSLSILGERPEPDEGKITLSAFSPGVWIYVESKK